MALAFGLNTHMISAVLFKSSDNFGQVSVFKSQPKPYQIQT